MWDSKPDEWFLLPALTELRALEIERELVDWWIPKLVWLIKTINSAVKMTVQWLLDFESTQLLISTSFDRFIEICRWYYNDIISWNKWNIWIDNFINYINLLFLILNVKKLYNTSPRDSFHDFYSLKCNTQLLRTVIPRWQDLPFLDITTWWSCHNYSIMFRDFFKKIWINSEIIFCNPVSNHSFLVIEIKGKYYQVDPLFNWKSFIKRINIWDQVQIWFEQYWKIVSFSPFSVEWFISWSQQEVSRSELRTFNDGDSFSTMLDKRNVRYIIVENYLNTIGGTFRIELLRELWEVLEINISIWDIEVSYKLKTGKIRRLFDFSSLWQYSSEKILSDIICFLYRKNWLHQELELDHILSNIWNIADMIKREDLLHVLWLL